MDHFGASLIEGLEDAVVVTDTALNVVAWNGVMQRLTGTSRAAALGRDACEMLGFVCDADVEAHLRRALAGEESSITEATYLTDGRTGWLQARYLPWRADDGRIAGVIGFHTDVSERRGRSTFVGALEAIGQSLTSSLDLNEVLDTIVGRALEVMSAESALVVSWDGRASHFSVMRSGGRLSSQYPTAGMIPAGGGPASRAILEGRPVVTSNILTDPAVTVAPARREQIEREGFKAVAAAPLRSKGRVHGALVVYYWSERRFNDDDSARLRLLAEQAALAIDNARIYAEATRSADRLRELAEVEQLVTESLVVDDVLRRITQATARLLNAPVVQLWTADPVQRVLRLQASSLEPGSLEVRMPRVVAFGEGVAGRVAETKTPVYVSDVANDPRALSSEWARESGIQRMLTVPILSGDDILGVLAVRSREESLANEENRALVISFAARAAVAMQNARTYAEAVQRAARLRDLAAVSRSITASLDSADVMQRIANAASAMRPGAMSAVHLLDTEARVLRSAARSAGEWDDVPEERSSNGGLPGLVVERHEPVLIPQPAFHPRTLVREWWQQHPKSSYYGVPIDVGDTFVGVLDYILPEGLPEPEEQDALRLLAAQAGVAIRNAGLYQAERAQAARIRALAAINQRMSGALDIDALLRMISESAAQLSGVRFASFWLADDATRTLSFMGGSVPEIVADLPERTVGYDTGALGWVARHRAPLAIDDVFSDERMAPQAWWRRWGLAGFLGYPVTAGDELLAILVLSHSEPVRFTPETADVVEMFVAQASVAVQNARLYREAQRRRDVAEVQARLARALTGTLDVNRIADLTTRGIVDLLGVRGSAVFRFEPTDGTLHALSTCGPDGDGAHDMVLRPGEGVAGRAVAERKVVVTSDILHEPRVELGPELRAQIMRRGLAAGVGVPLFTHERIIGALAVIDRAGREFTAEELQALQAFAHQAALAFENARLYDSARDSLVRLRETQAQLVQAAKMSALGQLVSGVAHELNNPLSVIIGYGQLLLAREAPEPLRRPVELMVSQGDRMAKIVRNLLYFARQRPPERSAVDIHMVLEQTLSLRLNQLTLSGITMETDFARTLPVINGDGQQLEQVFLNLLLNAEQAILEAKPTGRILLRTRVREDGRAIFADVIDDGPGIAPDALSRVFEPFFTTKVVGMGTGLGLSVSYGIAEEHAGRLSVQSRPGETIFTLELPVTGVAQQPPTDHVRRPPVSGIGRVALVVEDEPSVLDFVVTLLGETGWRVDVATGGRAGFELVRRNAYDLIVSDMRMPEGDGEELYRKVLRHDRKLARRFIFITGDTVNSEAWSFLEGTDTPVLEKPFSPRGFEDAVHRVLPPSSLSHA
ncbi:MAG TPA: GAF domain-containing protein [Candidatus Limnocylindria bacterium]|nr:GAF domain-containing protein [Candidatus Limnocylindria bacterium]